MCCDPMIESKQCNCYCHQLLRDKTKQEVRKIKNKNKRRRELKQL